MDGKNSKVHRKRDDFTTSGLPSLQNLTLLCCLHLLTMGTEYMGTKAEQKCCSSPQGMQTSQSHGSSCSVEPPKHQMEKPPFPRCVYTGQALPSASLGPVLGRTKEAQGELRKITTDQHLHQLN
jgi:hypothetical protein